MYCLKTIKNNASLNRRLRPYGDRLQVWPS